jgi:hypothetical protein
MERLQHETIATERDHNVRGKYRAISIKFHQVEPTAPRKLGGGANECHTSGPYIPRVGCVRPEFRQYGGHASFRCSSTGMSARTFRVSAWSTRAVAQPMPSETLART